MAGLPGDTPIAPELVEGIFHISDAEDALTTRETFLELGKLMGERIIEVPVPVPVVRMLGRLVGMGEEVDRLTRSLTTPRCAFGRRVRMACAVLDAGGPFCDCAMVH